MSRPRCIMWPPHESTRVSFDWQQALSVHGNNDDNDDDGNSSPRQLKTVGWRNGDADENTVWSSHGCQIFLFADILRKKRIKIREEQLQFPPKKWFSFMETVSFQCSFGKTEDFVLRTTTQHRYFCSTNRAWESLHRRSSGEALKRRLDETFHFTLSSNTNRNARPQLQTCGCMLAVTATSLIMVCPQMQKNVRSWVSGHFLGKGGGSFWGKRGMGTWGSTSRREGEKVVVNCLKHVLTPWCQLHTCRSWTKTNP